MSTPINKHNLYIEAADPTEGTFSGYVYLEDCPAALLDALRLRDLPSDRPVEIEGTFTLTFDDGWPIGAEGLRLWLVGGSDHSDGSVTPIRTEVVPYDIIEGGDDTLEIKILESIDLDSAAQSYAADQQDRADAAYESWKEDRHE